MNNVKTKIELSPQTQVSIKTRSAAIVFCFVLFCFFCFSSFLSLRSLYFPFPCSFLGGFSGSFCLRLLVFFSVKRLQFSFGTFSKIQQDNALAFTITYTLIFVNVPSSSNIPVSIFLKLFVFFLLKVNGEEGRIVKLILYDAQQCRVFEQVKLQCV